MPVKVKNLPVYRKSEEIVEITRAIVDIADKECDEYELVRLMLSNAYMIGAKIVGAEGGDLYNIRMECAVQVKVAACDLLSQASFCRSQGLIDSEYLKVLKDAIEEFRVLFVDWINTFDKTNNVADGWGLFE